MTRSAVARKRGDVKRSARGASVPAPAMRLQKWLAECGLGSRREIEAWIAAGRVRVNGVAARLGMQVGPDDEIEVDGRAVRPPRAAPARVLLLNKAEGVVCTQRDPQGRPTCFQGLPRPGSSRWINVGRLDVGTTGALLLTNDGALAHRLMHPSLGIDREYTVRIDRQLDDDALRRLREGVQLDDGAARFTDIARRGGTGHNHWYQVVLMEGRNREVRRLFESQGARVSRLKRVRYGPVLLPSALKRGEWMELAPADVAALYRLAGLEVPRQVGAPRRGRGGKPRSVLLPYPEPNAVASEGASGNRGVGGATRAGRRSRARRT